MNWPRVIGVTLSCSSVPSSFSRAMFCAVSSVPISVTSETRMPGHHVVPVVERRVVPAPDPTSIAASRAPAAAPPTARQLDDGRSCGVSSRRRRQDPRRVRLHDARGRALLGVDDNCTGARPSRTSDASKSSRDRQDHRHAAVEQRLVRAAPATPTARRSGSDPTRRNGRTRPARRRSSGRSRRRRSACRGSRTWRRSTAPAAARSARRGPAASVARSRTMCSTSARARERIRRTSTSSRS